MQSGFPEFNFSEAHGTIASTVIENFDKSTTFFGSLITLLDSDGEPVYNKSGDLMESLSLDLDGS